MKRHMYTDREGYSIFITTDKAFLAQPCRRAEAGVTTDKIVNELITTARRLDNSREGLGCLGLAANQLGYNVRIMVLKVGTRFKPFINPEIIERMGKQESAEICFSRPGKPPIKVMRSVYVKVAASNRKATDLYGLAARACQHELDHLNGVLI